MIRTAVSFVLHVAFYCALGAGGFYGTLAVAGALTEAGYIEARAPGCRP